MRRLALVALAFLAGCAEPDPGTTLPQATTIDLTRTRAAMPTTLAVRTYDTGITQSANAGPEGIGPWRTEGVALARAREVCRNTVQADLITVLSVAEPQPLLDTAGRRVGTEIGMTVRQGRNTGTAVCRYLDATGEATLSQS
jgi:hypothetical protein